MTPLPSPAPRPAPRRTRWVGAIARRHGRARIGTLVVVAIVVLLGYAVFAQWQQTVFEGQSQFGTVRVVERTDGLRTLYIGDGRGRQSAIHPGRPRHLELAYTRVGMVGLALMPPNGRVLFVGLGGGAMPMYTRTVMPDARIDVVEIDPLIVDVAQQYFGFTPDERMKVHTADGRAFIENAEPGTWDLIVLDAFSDDEIPFALTTREFLQNVRARLTPHGVVVSNLWTEPEAYPSMLATYRAIFDNVRLLRVPGHAQRILVAGPATRALDQDALVQATRSLAQRVDLGFDLVRLVQTGYEELPALSAPVLEDQADTASAAR